MSSANSQPAGEILFRDGDAATSAVLVLAGLVKIHKHGRDGDEPILSLRGPGDLLGEVSAAGTSAMCSTDASALAEVEAVLVPVAGLRALLARQPRIPLALRTLCGPGRRHAAPRLLSQLLEVKPAKVQPPELLRLVPTAARPVM